MMSIAWVLTLQGVKVDHAGAARAVGKDGPWMAHQQQAPVQMIVDGHDDEVLVKDVNVLHAHMPGMSVCLCLHGMPGMIA